MKMRLIVGVLLLAVVLVASGCQGAQPQPAAVETQAVLPPQGTQQVLPMVTDGPYPTPEAVAATVAPSAALPVLYPAIKAGETVDWDKAASMILNGEISQITQEASGKVTLALKDGRSLISQLPAPELLQQVIDKCSDLCKDVKVQNQ